MTTKISDEEVLKILEILDPKHEKPTEVIDKLIELLAALIAKNCYVIGTRNVGKAHASAETLAIIMSNFTGCLLDGFNHFNHHKDENKSNA